MRLFTNLSSSSSSLAVVHELKAKARASTNFKETSLEYVEILEMEFFRILRSEYCDFFTLSSLENVFFSSSMQSLMSLPVINTIDKPSWSPTITEEKKS
ncbi:hypothetical protein OGAPHI_002077 [Ogataea philodendri]|uniref:Uncharacterized protein n=1 Tax=Ogataea philodendri TaxID=1378263 RepID=A0A9P8P9Z7_9ASCO|nr:uncharacterized protein OGAPHI_002077 [Ogataea philodendri]KAH3668323.1 hypothetical protein OGAPHI_002077 [Ogataea philodendri]